MTRPIAPPVSKGPVRWPAMAAARRWLAVCSLVVLAPWPAHAQQHIYTWRDVQGTLVLSDRLPSAGQLTYPVDVEGPSE